jgi:hypothetical protein
VCLLILERIAWYRLNSDPVVTEVPFSTKPRPELSHIQEADLFCAQIAFWRGTEMKIA